MNTTDILENTLDALYTRECYINDFLTAEKNAYEELLPKHKHVLYGDNTFQHADCSTVKLKHTILRPVAPVDGGEQRLTDALKSTCAMPQQTESFITGQVLGPEPPTP